MYKRILGSYQRLKMVLLLLTSGFVVGSVLLLFLMQNFDVGCVFGIAVVCVEGLVLLICCRRLVLRSVFLFLLMHNVEVCGVIGIAVVCSEVGFAAVNVDVGSGVASAVCSRVGTAVGDVVGMVGSAVDVAVEVAVSVVGRAVVSAVDVARVYEGFLYVLNLVVVLVPLRSPLPLRAPRSPLPLRALRPPPAPQGHLRTYKTAQY